MNSMGMTLYININGEDIQSTEDVIVVGGPTDAILNEFYFQLAKEILKSVDPAIAKNIKKKSGIITDFEDRNPNAYQAIVHQWEELKTILLGENPTGSFPITLPKEYIDWLSKHRENAYNEIAKSLYGRGCIVELPLDKIYERSMRSLISDVNGVGFEKFVVADDMADGKSKIVHDIKAAIGDVMFVPLKNFGIDLSKPVSLNKEPLPVTIKDDTPKIVFAVLTEGKDGLKFHLMNENGEEISPLSFRLVNYYYQSPFCIDYYHPTGNTIPLIGYCEDDQKAYLITKQGAMPISDYSNGLFYKNINEKAPFGHALEIEYDFPYFYILKGPRYADADGDIDIYKYVNDNIVLLKKDAKSLRDFPCGEICGEIIEKRIDLLNDNIIDDREWFWSWEITNPKMFKGYKNVLFYGKSDNHGHLYLGTNNDNNSLYGCFVLNKEGIVLYDFQYDTFFTSCEGKYIIVSSKAKYGLIDVDGNTLLECKYSQIKEYRPGVFELKERGIKCFYCAQTNVFNNDEKVVVLDCNGTCVTGEDNCVPDKAHVPSVWLDDKYKRKYYSVGYDNGHGFHNIIFHHVEPIKHASILTRNRILIEQKSKNIIIDTSGNVIIAPNKLKDISKISDKYIKATEIETGKMGVYDMDGNIVIKPSFEDVAIIDY